MNCIRFSLLLALTLGSFGNTTFLFSTNHKPAQGEKKPAESSDERLFAAVNSDNLEAVEACFADDAKPKADPNALEKGNVTPLMLAAKKGNTSIIAMLLENNANAALADEDGWTALHFAAHSSKPEAVKLLLRAKNVDVNAKTKDDPNKTPLELAFANVKRAVTEKHATVIDAIESIRTLAGDNLGLIKQASYHIGQAIKTAEDRLKTIPVERQAEVSKIRDTLQRYATELEEKQGEEPVEQE